MKNPNYRFFYHYNKPLSKQKGKTMWSVHFKKKCYMVEQINCLVESFSKANKRQPYAVMQGFATKVLVDTENKSATIQ